ncbi:MULTISPECIES: hypothetical protein [Pectobacterium]|uniref:Haloacid dehalogenase-like hydrolase n=1 Tax=Pectobacterium carotovorum subsp. carotovorum (strain PC1) TaxID=561230 RepID=C6DAU2_PECCP|nr:hypothetical protein [Pectobacterium carotovorum]ACT13926.1 hypothetical protein PC1_2902 [Pectobacterium carotovorum subsp. carotovorum PC1]
MLFFSEFLIFWGLFAFTPKDYANTFPCSPIPFIQNGISRDWLYFENNENSQYERVGYDFDDTILISRNGGVIDGKPIFNLSIVNRLILDIKHKRKVYLISNRNENQRSEIIKLMRNIFSPQDLIGINIILLGGTNELKAKYIESNRIDVYYGDSDSDMVYAIMGGAKPIRVLRNTISKDKHGANIGIFKEFIMGCSQRAS